MKAHNLNKKSCLCISNDLSELEKLRVFISSSALNFGFNEEVANKITLAIDEACTNLIQYALNNRNYREICIEVEYVDNKKIIINILDDGSPFNPLEVKSPKMNDYFKNLKRGGLGIHLIKLIMDEIQYIPSNSAEKKNILKLGKSL